MKMQQWFCIALIGVSLFLQACGDRRESEAAATASVPEAQQAVVKIYNWTDYIAEDTIADFEKRTGIRVVYETYTENEALDAKLIAGGSGYDLVFPSFRPFAQQHLQQKLYAPLNRRRLPKLVNIDKEIMASLSDVDLGNSRLVPYMWGTTGLGLNVSAVKARLGENAPLDTWRLLFDPDMVAKLADCGVSVLDTDLETLSAALIFAGRDPNSARGDEIVLLDSLFGRIRKYISAFDSSDYIDKLASGEICLAMGYSGDIAQAAARAEELGNDIEILYVIPREGALRWIDVMAIPTDAPHKANAHTFINYLLEPEVIAKITNYVAYANPNTLATEFVDPAVSGDPGIYPPAEVLARLHDPKQLPDDAQKMREAFWSKLKEMVLNDGAIENG
jgi:putrescine transport system substrate-binding protein